MIKLNFTMVKFNFILEEVRYRTQILRKGAYINNVCIFSRLFKPRGVCEKQEMEPNFDHVGWEFP